MANVNDYLTQHGDLPLAELPFVEVDNVILSLLSYVDFSGIVPTDADSRVSIREAAQQYRKAHSGDGSAPAMLLFQMSETKRFAEMQLCGYTDVFNEETSLQFSAVQIETDDTTTYVAFRGTDDTITGWREDFSMSFRLMPSQKLAADYLRDAIRPERRYLVGGHSKGGNLAVYAALQCTNAQLAQIDAVYSNDGPGLCPDIIEMARYNAITPKLVRIVPEFSVVGALFEREPPTKIVASSAERLMQHDAFTWEVEGDHFAPRPARTQQCCLYNEIFDKWIGSASMQQRECFTRDFFNALEAGGAKSIQELSASGVNEIETILTAMTTQVTPQTHRAYGQFLGSIPLALRSIDCKDLLREEAGLRGICLLAAGAALMAIPGLAAKGISFCIGLFALYQLGRRLMINAFDTDGEETTRRYKLLFYMAAIAVVAYLMGKTALLIRCTNLLCGGLMFWFSAKQLQHSMQEERRATKVLRILIGLVLFALGSIPVLFSGVTITSNVAGICMAFYGIVSLIQAAYSKEKQSSIS